MKFGDHIYSVKSLSNEIIRIIMVLIITAMPASTAWPFLLLVY